MKSIRKSTVVLIVLAALFFILSVVSNNLSVSRTIKAIDEIGTLKIGDGSMERFEKAAEYYMALDTNRGLDKKITNAGVYDEARLNYCRLMIRQANLADTKNDGAAEAVAAARAAVDLYVPADEVWNIENYQDLLDLETEYNSDSGGAPQDEGEAPPMC